MFYPRVKICTKCDAQEVDPCLLFYREAYDRKVQHSTGRYAADDRKYKNLSKLFSVLRRTITAQFAIFPHNFQIPL